jgi:hypothetical protein
VKLRTPRSQDARAAKRKEADALPAVAEEKVPKHINSLAEQLG